MTITLKGNNPVFFLLERGIHLTLANPSALLNWEQFSAAEKNQILHSKRWGLIDTDEDIEFTPSLPVTPKRPANSDKKQDAPLSGTAPDLLLLGIRAFKEFLSSSNDMRLIRHMLELESSQKKRKTFLKTLHEKTKELQDQVTKSIDTTPSSRSPTRATGEPPLDRAYAGLIEESQQVEVTLTGEDLEASK